MRTFARTVAKVLLIGSPRNRNSTAITTDFFSLCSDEYRVLSFLVWNFDDFLQAKFFTPVTPDEPLQCCLKAERDSLV